MNKLKTALIAVGVGTVAIAAYFALYKSEPRDAISAGSNTSSNTGSNKDAKSAKGGGDKSVSVFTTVAVKKDFAVSLRASGVVSALNIVDIRPQVASTISKVHFKEGQFVKAGELLFTLDSRVDEVNLTKAQAQLDKDMVTLADTQRQLARSKELLDKKFISQSAVESSLSSVQAQQAVIASDKAAVAAARVALSYNRIVAPAAGRTGIINVYPGSLVQPNTTTLPLVTITQINPVAVTFPLPQRSLSDAMTSMKRSDSYVTARLPDSSIEFKGKLQFIDNQVDATSGTVKVKAIFDNKAMQLWPGAYVDVSLSVQTIKDAIVIPQNAIIVGVKGNAVYVVDAESKAALRPIKLIYSAGEDAVIDGVEAGMKVVREGKQNLRPGVVIKERSADDNKASDGARIGKGQATKPDAASSSTAAASVP